MLYRIRVSWQSIRVGRLFPVVIMAFDGRKRDMGETWDIPRTLLQVNEESCELAQACCHHIRGRTDTVAKIAEEFGDVLMSVDTLEQKLSSMAGLDLYQSVIDTLAMKYGARGADVAARWRERWHE